MNLKRKLVNVANRFGIDVTRYNHPQRMATDSSYAISHLLSNRKARVVLDVGANIGQSALAFRAQFPESEIYSFEPAAETFALLNSACQNDPKIHPFQLAVSDTSSDKEFFISKDPSCSSLLEPDESVKNINLKNKLTLAGSSIVHCTTLTEFCKQHSIEKIDFLKMDIQGAELQAISGGTDLFREKRIDVVFCEVLFSAMYKDACDFALISSAMKNLGYPLYGLYNLHHFLSDGLLWGDAIFVNPSLLQK